MTEMATNNSDEHIAAGADGIGCIVWPGLVIGLLIAVAATWLGYL